MESQLRLREIKWLVQGHTACQRQSDDSRPDLFDSKVHVLNYFPNFPKNDSKWIGTGHEIRFLFWDFSLLIEPQILRLPMGRPTGRQHGSAQVAYGIIVGITVPTTHWGHYPLLLKRNHFPHQGCPIFIHSSRVSQMSTPWYLSDKIIACIMYPSPPLRLDTPREKGPSMNLLWTHSA